MTTPTTAEVVVTVSGAKGSGKTTLIAVLAQALSGAGHTVTVPEDTPSAMRAIADLTRQYDVRFDEADDAPTALSLKQAQQRIADLEAKLADAESAALKPANRGVYSFQEAEDIITRAMIYIADAVKLDMSREDTREEFNRVRTKMATLRHEADARRTKASAMLRGVLTGTPEEPTRSTTAERTQAAAAARRLSPEDRLSLANGAQAMTTDEMAVASVLDEDTRRIAEDMAAAMVGESK